ncbi:hypothetical protein [Methylobacterium sp. Leaf117]|uniref:hypothetical protein n=1 Tax=Methylobacterium sp. Leaf117 TaxID=1736260 RepID=UPI00070205BB|nr:hypothetical protein [Methylobacterium sp. Leaf117]KQP94190.1 hypothetical protein ASF57_21725 [Methylobacterium sp. Leaf117]
MGDLVDALAAHEAGRNRLEDEVLAVLDHRRVPLLAAADGGGGGLACAAAPKTMERWTSMPRMAAQTPHRRTEFTHGVQV